MHSIWLGGTIAHHVVTHFTARRFHGLINLARRHREALGDDLEVIDHRLHLRLHLFAVGQHNFGRVCLGRAFRHAVQRLPHEGNRLSQLLHANYVPGKNVAFGCDRHFELEFLVARVGHITPQIKIHTASAQRWARSA